VAEPARNPARPAPWLDCQLGGLATVGPRAGDGASAPFLFTPGHQAAQITGAGSCAGRAGLRAAAGWAGFAERTHSTRAVALKAASAVSRPDPLGGRRSNLAPHLGRLGNCSSTTAHPMITAAKTTVLVPTSGQRQGRVPRFGSRIFRD